MGSGGPRSIHRLIEAQATRRPRARAVVFGDEALSYAELDARAGRLAHRLVQHGVGPDVIVGVHLERSLDLVVALLAVLKAGGAYLPLDPSYPADRLAFMLADCRAPVVIARGSLPAPFAGAVVDPAFDPDVAGDQATTEVTRDVDAEHLAYVIYTSGSTGTPKGVAIPHGRVLRLMSATEPWFHFDEHDVWTCFHSYAFDFSVWEIWGALISGGAVVVVPEAVRRSPDDLLALLAAEQVTVLNQVPSAFRHLIAAATGRPTRTPLALRVVIFGGEALDLRGLAPWFARYPAAPTLINMYGITETTVHVTYRVIDPAECATATGSPIGVPIPDLEVHLLDAALRPVADGEPGEIFVGGAGLARGYHARPALTAERFLPDPFSAHPGARMYRSGDLARRLPDGSLDYLGRNDAQVKIRGYRIELGEITATLAAHPAVREAAVVARQVGDRDDLRLIAYAALTSPVSTDELRAWLAGRLPPHMLPAAVVVVDALPITPSGKIDTHALAARELPAPSAGTGHAPPATAEERILAALWSTLLDVTPIGRDDRFFALGGHSLLAAQIVSRLSTDHGVVLPVRLFLTSPTLAEAGAALADALARGAETGPSAPRLPRRPHADRAPLSFAQEAIWVHDQILQDVSRRTRGYVEGPCLQLRGPVVATLLERALNEIAARHEIWRTSFVLDGDPVQVIGRSARIPLRLVDRREAAPAQRRSELEAVADALASQPFVLARAPLVRCALVTFADDEHALLLVMHHLVTDAWSEHLIARELARLYGLLVRGEPLPPRTEVEAQYGDYAAWERAPAQHGAREAARAYWRTRFADPPPPLALTGNGAGAGRPLRLHRPLGGEPSQRLAAFGRRHNLSPSAVLYAAFAAVLGRHAQGRFVLGVANANRTALSEQLPGCVSGVLPLVIELSDQPSFVALAHRVADVLAEAVPHSALSLPDIARLAGGGKAPLIQAQASTQLAAGEHHAGGVSFRQDYLPVNDAKFALKLLIQVHADHTVALDWVADPAALSAADLDALAAAFEDVLGTGLVDPGLVEPAPRSGDALPRTEEERVLAALWAEVLHVPRVGTRDDFFLLGGHSLLAIRLVTRIRAAFAIELSLGQLLAAPTVEALAAEVARVRAAPGPAHPGIEPAPRDRPLVASNAQERMWFIERMLAPDGPRPLHLSLAISLRGALDVAALARSLTALIARHEIWRTNVRWSDRQLVQVIAPPFTVELPVIRPGPVAAEARADRLQQLARAQAGPAFDLANGRLLRAQLVALAADDHVLLVAVHHIIADGPSAEIVLRELAALYAGTAAGPPAVQYADLAHWQRTALAPEQRERQLGYWRGQLLGAPALALPLDGPRPAVFSHAGDRLEALVPPAITAATRAFAQREGVSLFATLIAAFAALLARRTGQTDLVIGTTVTLRDRAELDGMLGPLLNLVALRVDASGDPTFRELVERARDVVHDALAHRDVAFEHVVAALGGRPDPSRGPVFQAALTFNQLPAPLDQGGLRWTLAFPDPGSGVHEDLSIHIGDDGATLRACFDYRTALFTRATIELLAADFEATLARGVGAPDEPMSAAGAVHPTHVLIEAQVDRTPDAIALALGDQRLTYRELDERANQLAHGLVACGARADEPIGVVCERSLDLVIALLAIWKAGGGFLPIEPGHPRDRIRRMLGDGGVRLVVGHARWSDVVEGSGARALWLDRDRARLAAHPTTRPGLAVDGASLAYVLFTSGSTGRPKGVMVEHRALASYLAHCRRAYPVSAARGSAFHSSIAFDLTVTSVFAPLISGATTHVVPDGPGIDPLIATALAAGPLGFLKLTPSHLELLARAITPAQVRGLAGCLIVGGEQLLAHQLALWHEHAPELPIVNEYGPTEAVVGCCVHWVTDEDRGAGAIPIGRAFAGNQLRVLDDALASVATGESGELYIAGAQVARGYVARPDLTAERFVPDPVGAPGTRMYRTGDRVRVRRDGVLELIGRVDHQVKIRGHRVELGEIEHALATIPAVRQGAVIARDDRAQGKQLVAFVVAAGDALDVDALRDALAAKLPDYMIPAAFVVVPALALTASGKLDRRALAEAALPAPARAAYAATGYAAPRDRTEALLAGIWAELLGVAQIGIHDNFFDLGGHSLLAAHVVARVAEVFGVELPLRTMFEVGTIAELAARIPDVTAPPGAPPPAEQAAQAIAIAFAEILQRPTVGHDDSFFELGGQIVATQRLIARLQALFGVELPLRCLLEAPTPRALAALLRPGAPPDEADDEGPLSYAQLRMWFLHQLAPASAAYHLPLARRLRGALDVEALRRALEAVVHRHAALHTTFPARDGVPRQVVQPPARLELPIADVSAAADRERALTRLVEAEVDRPFELAVTPPFRARLVRVAADDHVLAVVIHHIIADDRSLDIVWREVTALVRGEPVATRPLAYTAYAAQQRARLTGDVLAAQLAFWKHRLAGAPAQTDLPYRAARPRVSSARPRELGVDLGPAVARQLRELGRREGASPFMTCLAVLRAVLARMLGQDDVCIGAPVSNRDRPELDAAVGMFVNTLVFRTPVEVDASFVELVRRERAAALDAYERRDAPFEEVVRALGIARDATHPLFQISFAYLATGATAAAPLDGLRDEPYHPPRNTAQFDLEVEAWERGDSLEIRFTYKEDLFDPWVIAGMAEQLACFVREVVRAPDRAVSRVPLVDAAERTRLVTAWNPVEDDAPATTFAALFEAAVDRAPDATAVILGDARHSYRQLDEHANRIAAALRAHGIGADAVVALALERSFELIAAVVGVLKAGGAYLPLDPRTPAARLQQIVEASRPRALVSTRELAAQLPALALPLVDARAPSPGPAPRVPARPLAPDHLAYVMFTSGSTGAPKGVMISQRALTSALAAMTRTICALAPDDGLLQLAPYTFDQSVIEMLWPLANGARVVLVAEADQHDPARLVACIADGRVTILDTITTILRALVAEPGFARCASLRQIGVGGEALPIELVRAVFAVRPDVPVLNGYGPTEATVAVCYRPVAPDADVAALGAPWDGVQLYVLDHQLEPTPVGTAGELYIAGRQLARGYAARPDLTGERFVPDPFARQPGRRMYRTGDRVRRLPDGTLEFLGRLDEQVKLHGFRVELGEIEDALRKHAAVHACAVIAAPPPRDGAGLQLVAYVVLRRPIEIAALRDALAGQLPGYMVPAAYVVLDALPMTAGGKLDRRALPAPSEAARGRAPTAARSADERAIAAIWCEVLGVEAVGIHDDFFALGGHSLLATQVVSRVRARLDVALTLQQLFDHPTVERLAAEVARAANPPAATTRPPPRDEPAVLSYAQQQLWLVHRMSPTSAAYHLPAGRRIRGPLDGEALRRAFEDVVHRHDSLRTVFPAPDGVPHARVLAPARWELALDDLATLEDAERHRALDRIAHDDATQRFDLEAGPVLRTRLARLGPDDHVLLVTMHHIVTDGWSLDVFWREVAALYAGHRRGQPVALPPLPVQYPDFAASQRAAISGDVLDRALAYWRQQLAGAPHDAALPHRAPRSAGGAITEEVVVALDAELTRAVRATGQREGATLFMTLLAAFRLVVARTTGQADLVIGTPIANRPRKELEALIGLFVNTVALRREVDPRATFAELVRGERATMLAAHAHQDAPFERIVDDLGVERSATRTPVFQLWFVQEGVAEPTLGLDPALAEEPFPRGTGATKFDLSAYVNEARGGVELALVFDAALLARAVVEGIARRFVRALELGTGAPDRSLAELDLGDPPAGVDPRTPLARPAYPAVLETLAELARRDPGAVALRHRDRSYTRGELAAAASRVAAALTAAGVVEGQRVALTGPPCFALHAGFIGILQRGACLVPLSPRLSRDHAARLLERADVRVVLQAGAAPRAAGQVPVATIADDGAVALPAALPPARHPTDPALRYLYFTSGTTGAQKGVVGDLQPLAHFVAWQRATFGELAGGVHAQLTELGFDVFLRDTMFALTSGQVMAVPPDELAALEPGELLRWLERERVTAIHTVPSLARAWLQGAPADVTLPDLRCVFVVGEPLDGALVERWRRRFRADTEIINFYGTTETGPAKCWYRVPHPPLPGLQPIGRPLPQTQVLIMRGAQLCAAGEVGEVVIRTPFSTLGYLDDRAAGAFHANPFRADPSDRLYRTGDLGRDRLDGTIELLGRADDQVKLHGQRVDPAGVAAALRAQPGVLDAAVIATRVDDEVRLVAYVVRAQPPPSPGDLRAQLSQAVPPYMIPARFVALDALPVRPNGKLDRGALPAVDWTDGEADAPTAPRSPEEEAIAAIWRDVLDLERVGVRDDFFALGGHSLLAVLLASRVRAVFGVELGIQQVFEAPTVAGIAAVVMRARAGAPPAVLAPIARIARAGDLPLSFAQQRMWFLHRLSPASPAYHVALERRLRGALAREPLRRAFEEIVRRHEALRAVFPSRDGVPVQQIGAPPRWELPFDDLSELAGAAGDAAVARLARDEAERPFDLATGPLLRTRLVRLAPDDHLLLVTLHHIVSDGWSMAVFWGEVSELYAASTTGRPARLAALPIQHVDFAAWQRAALAGGALDAQLAYWTAKLAGAPATTALPAKARRPGAPSARGGAVAFELGEAVVGAVRALGRKTGATPFIILLAAFRAVLARTTGQDDLCIGTPIANRGREELEPLIGLLLNTLVLRTEIDPRRTFSQLVRHERATALEAYAHQDAPFEQVVDALEIERSLDRTPLFQVSFVHQNMPQRALPIGDLVDEPSARAGSITRFDLSVVSFERDRKILFELVYNAELFERWQIEQLAGHYVAFVGDALRDPERPVAQIPMLSEAERRQLVLQWNRTAGAVVDSTIPALFEAAVDRTPDATALVLGAVQLTYRALDARANRIAHALAEHGVGPEVVVGIALERSFDLVAALLGTSKAGGAWVPLDPHLPAARLAAIAHRARPAIVLATTATAATLPAITARVITLDDPDLDRRPATRPAHVALAGDHLAYVLFTSGSTGHPKGVMISHRGIVNELISAQALRAPLDGSDAFLQLAPYTFDLSVHEILWPLSTGARVVLLPEGDHRDPRRIVEEIRARGVTILHPVPTLLRALLADPDFDRCTSLRVVVSGGEPMPLDVLRAFTSRRPDLALINSYGPTEASVTVSQWRARADATAVAIGTPWIATQLYALDPHLEPVPLGVAGELYIGGRQVGRGYAGQPAGTAERFVPDPFAAEPGARMYRTGDRVRRWLDGNLELIGRADHQVKLRGFRIELGEIEAVLRAHAGVREAVVVIHGPGEDARLVAYVVSAAWSAEAARAALASHLPDYMVPRVFVRLDALPLGPSGKIDRAALPAPDAAALERRAYEPPRAGLEELLAGIWSELLGVPRIGRRDDFFDLGGHSLLAARLAWQAKVSIAMVFAAPTIAGLAAAIEASRAERGVAAPPPIAPIARGGALALSYAQQRMWFLHQLSPTSAAYHISIGRRLRGPLDTGALAGALGDLIARHEILRTVFPAPGGVPAQEVRPAAPWPLPVHELAALAASARAAELARISDDEASRPFDLARGPLLRTALLCTAPDDHVLHVTLHHIIADGWSVGLFWHEVEVLYAARVQACTAPLAPLAVQYADYAAWQRGWLTGDVLEAQLAYWKERLAGAPEETALPTRGPRPRLSAHRGASTTLRLDRARLDRLRALSKHHGCTLFITLLAAFRALLYRYTGQRDLCIAAPTANRGMREVEGLIGLFVNPLVLRTPAAGSTTFAELLSDERTTALEAYAHGEAPFEMIVEALGVARSLSRNPLFQVMFQVQFADDEPAGGGLPGVTSEAIERGTRSTQVDLDAAALVHGDGIELVLTYNVELFDHATVVELARHFRALLDAAIADPDTRLADLALLTRDERDQLVHAWNHTIRATPRRPLPALIDERAARTPAQVAIAARAGTLTYRALVERANQLAHHLRARGLAREERVGIHLDRGLDLVVAMLGVWKAGGAYLPLDAELPADRLAYMAADAGVRIVLTGPAPDEPVPAEQAIVVDFTSGPLADEPTTAVAGAPALDQLAYVLYTSGSTGRPKAVHVQHGSLVNFLESMRDAPGLSERDTLLAVTTAAFDISGLELFLPLLVGARVVVAGRDDARDAARLQALLADSAATVMQATPSTWRMLVDTGWHPRPGFVALCGGEALPPELAAALVPRVSALWNLYGPTETTIWSARARVLDGAPIRLGEPIANTQLHVLDPDSLDVQPLEVAGELFIAGDGLARGYGGLPGLTAERFVPDPFAATPGARMYRTGDRARRRAGGELEFLGRADHQIKLRGFRIELGEIEAVLADHPRVAEVAVAVRGERLVAYVVPFGNPPASDALLSVARARLPDYMIPSAVVVLDELPRSLAGKLDRQALPAPEGAALAAAGYAAPRTEVEEILAGIWGELLGVPRVGGHDNFFELGGHSLLAVRVVWAINRAFAIALPLERLFSAPTIGQLAPAIEAARRHHAPLPPPARRARAGELPLSYAQERMWFLHQLAPASPAYHIATGFRLRGALDVDALAGALGDTVRRHEALRTRFPATRGVPRQEIDDVARWALAIDDLSHVAAADRDEALARHARAEANRPFDLAADALLRSHLVRLAPDDHAVLATMHHIIADGWSLDPFWTDVRASYLARTCGAEAPVELPIQYADYATWQREHLAGEVLDRQLAYWKRKLAGAPRELVMPRRRPRPALQTYRGGLAVLDLERELADGLRAIARRAGATLVMALLASLRALLYRATGQTDVCIGVPTANRATADLAPLVGLFVNTLVLRTTADPDAGFAALVAAERVTALEAYAHQEAPFERVIDALGVARALDRNPLFQVLFQAWFDDDQAPPTWGDATAEPIAIPRGATHLDLDVSALVRPDRIEVAFAYNADLFEHATVVELAHHFRALIAAAVAAPDQPIAALPLALEPIAPPAARPEPPIEPPPVAPAVPTYVPARSEAERSLVAIWQQVLGVPRVGVRDNFFEIGGHSLLAIRLLWETNRAFDATIPLTQLFSAPTIEQLATVTALASGGGRPSDRVALQATQRTRAHATALQRLHHDIHRDDPTNPFEHMALGLALDGGVERDALERALTDLVRRHAILRTCYREIEGQLVQVVTPAEEVPPFALEITDLSALPAPAREAHQHATLRALRTRAFDLTRGPALRGALVVHAPARCVLALIVHHTCGDGPSIPVIVDELRALYRHHVEPGHAAPAVPALQFIDFADYVERFTASPVGRAQRAYWAHRLEGAPPVELPLDHDRAAVDRRRDAAPRGMVCFPTHSVTAIVPAAVRRDLVALARETDATMMMILLAGFAATLQGLTGQTDICIQSTLSQRSQHALDRVIGVVANSLILRLDLAGGPSFRALVRRTQAVVAAAFEHGVVPVIDRASHTLRRVNFNFTRDLTEADEAIELAPGLRACSVDIPLEAAKTPLDLHLWLFEHDDGIALRLLGNQQLFRRETCERVLQRFTALLARVGRDPQGSAVEPASP